MPGIYLHIPFCKQACHYCNFHFSTSLQLKAPLLAAMLRELDLRRDFFGEALPLDSVYLGGGTPSLLSRAELESLFEHIRRHFHIAPDAEITLEANPDDLTDAYLNELRQTPVNRLSIGIQSFSDADLKWMNRAHHADEARRCIESALAAGFDNLTCDLIYGAPTTSDEQWAANIQTLLDYGIPHLSCYCLTVEPKTALAHFVKTGKSPAVEDEKAARQFQYLMDAMAAAGYEHYEISNFARPGRYARHNTAYWRNEPYLGIGPGAHSYIGHTRQWNLPNNALYVRQVAQAADWKALEGSVFEQEYLQPKDRYNEYVMTRLRTMWGCRVEEIERLGAEFAGHFVKTAAPFLQQHLLTATQGAYRLSRAGKLMADFVSAELFWVG
jgi:oxygen-independent coproporphyrinogen III oxidase